MSTCRCVYIGKTLCYADLQMPNTRDDDSEDTWQAIGESVY